MEILEEKKRMQIEAMLAEYPICQYGFLKSEEIVFSEKVRYICRTECGRYGKSWSCPPAVGEVEACRQRCLQYANALIFTTLAEVSDLSDMEETLATRFEHEKVVKSIREALKDMGEACFALSSESCARCTSCAYPAACRYPETMLPCIESQGILVTAAAEACGIEYFYGGNVVTWYGVLFFGRTHKTEKIPYTE